MVKLGNILLCSVKKVRQHLRGQFLDSLRLNVRGGHGGNGLPKYGGVGGQGGCVYFLAKDDVTLKKVVNKHSTKRISASPGEDSSKFRILGRRGADVCVEVPIGIQVVDEQGKIMADLNKEGTTCLAAGGGIGGCSGTSFLGKPGDVRTIKLDLRLIADVGLVGFPNAGKSTFLKAISNASPKIASYPFTTIRPQIGVVDYKDYRQISIADLPGLIEGAHANIGMGHKFLKHVERTRLLLMIVDIFGFRLSVDRPRRTCLENIYSLNKELELYDETLLSKPCVLLINKMDLKNSEIQLDKIQHIVSNLENGLDQCPEEIRPNRLIQFEKIIPISAKDKTGMGDLKNDLRKILDDLAEKSLQITNIDEKLQRVYQERGPVVC